MADIDVLYNGDKMVIRLINLDVNYPSDDRIVTYQITNYALSGGAVAIKRQAALPARVSSGAEVTLFFKDMSEIELPGGIFKPFEEGSNCEITWTCSTEKGAILAGGNAYVVCQGAKPGIDIANATIVPNSSGYADFIVFVGGTELVDSSGNKGMIKGEFTINGYTQTIEDTLENASVPKQETTFSLNPYLPKNGDLYVTVTVKNPDGTSAHKEFYFDFKANLTPIIKSMEVLQINAENREIRVTWDVDAVGDYRWAITASEVGSDTDWQKASSGTNTVPSGMRSIDGITFDDYKRYNITLWVYYDYDNRTYSAYERKTITLSRHPNSSAKTEVIDHYRTTLYLHITGLDNGYLDTDRYAVYSIAKVPNIAAADETKTVPLEGGVTSGANVLFGVAEDVVYYVWCDIYNGNDELIKALPMIVTNSTGFNITIDRAFPNLDVLRLEWNFFGNAEEVFFNFDEVISESDFKTGTGEIIPSNPTRPPAQHRYDIYYTTSGTGTDYVVYTEAIQH